MNLLDLFQDNHKTRAAPYCLHCMYKRITGSISSPSVFYLVSLSSNLNKISAVSLEHATPPEHAVYAFYSVLVG